MVQNKTGPIAKKENKRTKIKIKNENRFPVTGWRLFENRQPPRRLAEAVSKFC
jgi:hypothetical protein